ncbi:AIM24 family protein [Rhodococcus sp. BP-349]|uniref:AIM24 family protein n=1 Tax=unclassified Rhodococcus (in: high G+C Gram-positive bacteria) TaxID=192944 RepID=UPI001C9A47A6|nr:MULTISPECIES: AIM24 family protein [unclassified Rhodococcus (in: high G+C Gram-positive bacteria)]MBY6538174.1 AIM24 family protein [Rhodococcus sp. BP-363]MBY6542511.1 AIM24 family protein [Rhodococcus sp. BP-369]MBY6561741.1 AIM24 family protein [Rhodococcus sp. BP-370]MBY6576033.1 AIM24 family protein [Rhodococcus sp. BP-364]MBY6585334.1 AIM24 family protein [Rhodococcus sp. BP-358]
MLELVNSKVVKSTVAPGSPTLARRGSMLFHQGDVRFVPHTIGGAGGMPGMGAAAGMAGRMMSGEHVAMMAAEGSGTVHYGHAGLHVSIIDLDGTGLLSVEASRLLAHSGPLSTSVVPLTQQGGVRGAVRGAMTGQGMFTTQVAGRGQVAVLSHGGTVEIEVGPHRPQVVVDPQAYVCHRGTLTVDISANVGWRDAVGRGSGEAVQLAIGGAGTVWVQASEQKF